MYVNVVESLVGQSEYTKQPKGSFWCQFVDAKGLLQLLLWYYSSIRKNQTQARSITRQVEVTKVQVSFLCLVAISLVHLKVSHSFQEYTLEPNAFLYVANFGITHKKYRTQNILKRSIWRMWQSDEFFETVPRSNK